MLSSAKVVFVSDAHFGLLVDAAERRRRASFLEFLDSLYGVERLVVAGVLFQFWCDLGSTIPKAYFELLNGLSGLRRSGTRIDYVAGNHDFWRSSFFKDQLGIETHAEELELHTQSRRVLVLHGDGAGPGDHGYKLLKRVLRHPITSSVARLVHPDLLYVMARRLDRASHARTSRHPVDARRLDATAREAFERGYDALVMGHVHTQVHKQLEAGELVVLGDWLELCSYAVLENGAFTPARWNAKDA
jgi:UDP-2,3-diacylglucosamine hydrolase